MNPGFWICSHPQGIWLCPACSDFNRAKAIPGAWQVWWMSRDKRISRPRRPHRSCDGPRLRPRNSDLACKAPCKGTNQSKAIGGHSRRDDLQETNGSILTYVLQIFRVDPIYGRDVSYNPIMFPWYTCRMQISPWKWYAHHAHVPEISKQSGLLMSKLPWVKPYFPHILMGFPMNSQKNSTCSIPPYSYADVWSPGNFPYT